MKRINVLLTFSLLFLFSSISNFAQGSKGGNGIIFQEYSQDYILDFEPCPGLIIHVEYQKTIKQHVNGYYTMHRNISGEGYDLNGILWKMHDVINERILTNTDRQIVSIMLLHGSNGQILKKRFIERWDDGELKFLFEDPLVD